MSRIPDLLVNGRFLTRRPTGVDRVAIEWVRALSRRQAKAGVGRSRIDVALPRCDLSDGDVRRTLQLDGHSRICRSGLRGHLWEQTVLPFVAPRHVLLSLCNTGPVLRSRQLVLIHDAQAFDVPGSYSRAFVLAYRTLLPPLAARARWLATVSAFARERLAANGVGSRRSIAVVHNGVDHFDAIRQTPDTARKYGLLPRRYFLVVGSPAPHKNLAMLAQANALRSAQSTPIAIVGSIDAGIYHHSFSPVAEGLKPIGRVSDEDLKGLYSEARALLLPSLTEGFGLAALEAMRCGCPVIAADAGAIPEVCGDAATYCSPTDALAWAQAMDRHADSAFDVAGKIAAGQERAALFTWDDAAERVATLLSGTVAD